MNLFLNVSSVIRQRGWLWNEIMINLFQHLSSSYFCPKSVGVASIDFPNREEYGLLVFLPPFGWIKIGNWRSTLNGIWSSSATIDCKIPKIVNATRNMALNDYFFGVIKIANMNEWMLVEGATTIHVDFLFLFPAMIGCYRFE